MTPRDSAPFEQVVVRGIRGRRRLRRGDTDWVNKSHVMQWVRCPYAFSLLDSGQVKRGDALSPAERQRVADGISFQRRVEGELPRVAIPAGELPGFIAAHPATRLFNPGRFENPALKYYGDVDAFDVDDGALYPIEVKNHRRPQRTDLLELAFYWRLLEPLRTRDVRPEGTLILPGEGGDERVRVVIEEHHFVELDRHVTRLREARRRGHVRPRICRCTICSHTRRHEVLAAELDAKGLSLLFDLGRVFAAALEEHCSIASWQDLLDADPQTIAPTFRSLGHPRITPAAVGLWILHGNAYATGKPQVANPVMRFPVPEHFIALDLEYDPDTRFVWLAGACVVRGSDRQYLQEWATTERDESRSLCRLLAFVERHPDLPVVTWNGRSADFPMLLTAAHGLELDIEPLRRRHVDLYEWVKGNFRIPIPCLDLKSVTEYFAVARLSSIRTGLEALGMYRKAARTDDRLLRARLHEYNRDDLDGLVHIVEALRQIVDESGVEIIHSRPSPDKAARRRQPRAKRWWEADDIVTIELPAEVLEDLSRGTRSRRQQG